jgi:hypothetical protein
MVSNAWRSISVAPRLAEKPDVVIAPSVPLGRLGRSYREKNGCSVRIRGARRVAYCPRLRRGLSVEPGLLGVPVVGETPLP